MKIGIVGTGTIVQEVLPHFRDWGIEPAGLCGTERSRDVVAELCAANEIPFGTSSYAEFLANASFDTVYIAVPNHLHFEMSKMALEAGKNVIVEKPMTSNAREARELAELAAGIHVLQKSHHEQQPRILPHRTCAQPRRLRRPHRGPFESRHPFPGRWRSRRIIKIK